MEQAKGVVSWRRMVHRTGGLLSPISSYSSSSSAAAGGGRVWMKGKIEQGKRWWIF